VKDLASGGHHALALREDGTVWSWGSNFNGQLGNGSWGFGSWSATPAPVPGLTDVVDVSARFEYSAAVRADGTVWAWGGTMFFWSPSWEPLMLTPAPVPGLTGVTSVVAGTDRFAARREDGTVWTWSTQLFNHLAGWPAPPELLPTQVPDLTDVVDVAITPEGFLALRANGTLWTWSANGQPPAQVAGLTDVVALSASTHTLAVRADGSVWAWGSNANGELGTGTPLLRATPTVAPLPCRFTALPSLEHANAPPRPCIAEP
jgi:alpha-tubulin suppressor-like RCC1 family protein